MAFVCPAVLLALLVSQPAAAEPPPAAPATPATTAAPASMAEHAWHLVPALDIGFGFPTGFIGGHAELRSGRFSFGAGAGMGFGGPQFAFGGWASVIELDPGVSFDVGLWASHGAVQSRGDLGGIFGPDHRYSNAWWLSLPLALGLRPEVDAGPTLRLIVGPAILLNPESGDSGVFMLGFELGWDIPL
ncbi:MAG: hypothetical protein U1F43_28145 [Myxococcota bacterium]